MSQHLGYIVAFVRPDGSIGGIATSTIGNYREAHASLRVHRATFSEPVRSELQVVRVEGFPRSKQARPAKGPAK